MASRKISELTALTAPASADVLPIVDVSEALPENQNKKITYAELLSSAPAGTAAAPSFAFDGDTNTGIYSPGADQVAISTGGTGRLFVDASGRLGINTSSPTTNLNVKYGALEAASLHELILNADFGSTNNGGGRIGITFSGDPVATVGAGQKTAGVYGISTDSTQFTRSMGLVFNTSETDSNSTGKMWLKSSGRLGVGTQNPDSLLHCSTSGTTVTAQFSETSKSTLKIWHPSAGQCGLLADETSQELVFGTNNSERLRITSAGLVGIGTSSPAQLLEVENSSGNAAINITSSDAGYAELYFGDQSSASAAALSYEHSSNNLRIYNGGSVRATIDSSGRVGIGTTSPGSIFDVKPSASSSTLRIEAGTINSDSVRLSAGGTVNTYLEYRGYLGHAWFVDATQRACIDSSGRLLVGTASVSIGTQLEVLNTAGSATAFVVSGQGDFPVFCHNKATSGDNNFINFGTEASFTTRGSVTYNRAGGVVAYNTTSDYRAKAILGVIQNPGDTIDALKVYRGVMNGATTERPMLVAHEAQEVAPYCVTGEKDAVDDDGNPIYQQMDHQVLVPLLIAEIQQLRTRVAALEGA